MSKAECLAGCRVRPKTFTRVPSITRYLREPTGRQVNKGIDPTLAFERVSSCLFERVSSVQSQRLQRDTSITTDATETPSMIHRTPYTEMLEDFQTLKVQGASSGILTCSSSLACSLFCWNVWGVIAAVFARGRRFRTLRRSHPMSPTHVGARATPTPSVRRNTHTKCPQRNTSLELRSGLGVCATA
jgi:hypothetical protein